MEKKEEEALLTIFKGLFQYFDNEQIADVIKETNSIFDAADLSYRITEMIAHSVSLECGEKDLKSRYD